MIFVTVGTHEPFDRLVRAVDEWCAGREDAPEVMAQITARAEYRPGQFEAVATLDPGEYERVFQRARVVVSHAGMGSIITALSRGKPIVILPRRGHLRETRNDHQFATMQRFRDKPGIFAAEDETMLPAVLDRVVGNEITVGAGISPYASPELIEALGCFIREGK